MGEEVNQQTTNMDEVDIQRHIEEIQTDIIQLKKRVETLSKQQGIMNTKQEKMNDGLADTNKEAHLAKHGVENLKGDLKGFITLFEKNQKTIDHNQEAIRDLMMDKKITEEKVQKVLTWLEDFSEIATFKGWEEKMKEISENTKFRQMFGSWYSGILGMAAIFAAILAALAFSKKFGL